ncbi:MAG TPA: transketolase [Treponema sp.]|nr:MAG: transketolase [Treponema sp. GWA1_62_8]OHE65818.1 MAG: transketolase [Treponema sp. GWC1_61_84]OHE71895.1 MAG: transketolase [Treponema sp. RIFOXYC1_FULL_61_9]HCM28628.1 transketolase [Treponema sp.]
MSDIANTRAGFRDGLVALAEKRDDIVFVSTDSVKVVKAEDFAKRWPERMIEVGIAEQNGVAVSAGLAASGMTPYLCTYAGFLTMRACEQMRTFVAYPKLKVRFVGVNAGLFGGNREGVSHQFIEDIGILRAIPGFTILCPADGDQVKQAVLASADTEGPVYIRIGSGKEERVFPDGTPFRIGKIRIIGSSGRDVALFCHGFVTNRVIRAAAELEKAGVRATVVEVATIKPLDVAGISEVLGKCGCAVSIEDHNVIGGLGSAIAEVIAEHAPATLARLGLQDRYGESGHPDELLDAYGMSTANIAETAKALVARKKQGLRRFRTEQA